MYELNLGTIEDGYEDEIRTRLGVDSVELTDDMINTLSIIGAAEMAVLELVPLADTITNQKDLTNLNLAFMNLAAYYAWPGLKLRLLQTESDNKSIATRFKASLDQDPIIFLRESQKYLSKITTVPLTAYTSIELLEFSAPATDEVTGNAN